MVMVRVRVRVRVRMRPVLSRDPALQGFDL